MKGSPEFIAKVQEMKAVSAEAKAREEATQVARGKSGMPAMLTLSNIPHATVPEGRTPEESVVHATNGSTEGSRRTRFRIGRSAGFDNLVDLPRGAKVTGAGFPFFIGDGAQDCARVAPVLFG